jgi:ABC-type Fe3+ transport system substrate-binding protein
MSVSAIQGVNRRQILSLATAGAALSLSRGWALAAGELDALYENAKREGALVYYAGGPTGPHQSDVNEFSKAFPGIKCELATGFSNQLSQRVDDQVARGRIDVDICNLQTIQGIERWKRANAILPNRGPNFDMVADAFKDADGSSVGVRVYALAYGFNPDLVAAEDVPKSALDFLDRKFYGKVISTYPHDDDVTLYLYYNIVQKYGWDYMRRLMNNKPRFIRGHLGVTDEIAKGRAALSFDVSVSTVVRAQKDGGRIDGSFPADDLIPVWENRLCLFKNSPNPNAAKLFQAWLLSREHQVAQGLWSPRRDVPAEARYKAITDYKIADRFRDFILNDALVTDLRNRFQSYIGPVGGDPVLSASEPKK